MVRASVASLACASATVITAALLAGREERSPFLIATSGGFAIAAAIFATASSSAALRLQAQPTFPREAIRTTLDGIASVAQAGTIGGDQSAVQHAFAMIARQAGECSALLDGL